MHIIPPAIFNAMPTTTPHFNTKHGHSRRGKKTKTYETWCSMHRRCYLPSQFGFKYYGAKGIEVVPEWHSFQTFLNDMGEQPERMTLDRINAFGDYSKSNCRWASALDQARNRSSTRWIEFQGERLALTAWAERLGIAPKTLRARLDDHGWSVERALSTPVMSNAESGVLAAETRHGRLRSPWVTRL